MSLALLGAGASYEFRWRRWSLLRDVVEAHLGGDFPVFMSIGEALGGATIRLSAQKLASEMRALRDLLVDRPITDLVIGPTTARVLYPRATIEAPRPLTHLELNQVAPIGDSTTLAHYFSSMIDSILDVCAHPLEDGTVEVIDG